MSSHPSFPFESPHGAIFGLAKFEFRGCMSSDSNPNEAGKFKFAFEQTNGHTNGCRPASVKKNSSPDMPVGF